MIHSDRPKHAYLNPLPDSRIRPRCGFAAGGDEVCGGDPVLDRIPGRVSMVRVREVATKGVGWASQEASDLVASPLH